MNDSLLGWGMVLTAIGFAILFVRRGHYWLAWPSLGVAGAVASLMLESETLMAVALWSSTFGVAFEVLRAGWKRKR